MDIYNKKLNFQITKLKTNDIQKHIISYFTKLINKNSQKIFKIFK